MDCHFTITQFAAASIFSYRSYLAGVIGEVALGLYLVLYLLQEMECITLTFVLPLGDTLYTLETLGDLFKNTIPIFLTFSLWFSVYVRVKINHPSHNICLGLFNSLNIFFF